MVPSLQEREVGTAGPPCTRAATTVRARLDARPAGCRSRRKRVRDPGAVFPPPVKRENRLRLLTPRRPRLGREKRTGLGRQREPAPRIRAAPRRGVMGWRGTAGQRNVGIGNQFGHPGARVPGRDRGETTRSGRQAQLVPNPPGPSACSGSLSRASFRTGALRACATARADGRACAAAVPSPAVPGPWRVESRRHAGHENFSFLP